MESFGWHSSLARFLKTVRRERSKNDPAKLTMQKSLCGDPGPSVIYTRQFPGFAGAKAERPSRMYDVTKSKNFMSSAHGLLRWKSKQPVPALQLFLILVVLGFGLRAGYGVARYRSAVIKTSGVAFITLWDHDALEHVLIAKALLSGRGYVVDEPPDPSMLPGRLLGQEALFKAPLYEFFLAGIFWFSGFSFKVLIPLQGLLGGLLAGFVGLIALQVFRRPNAAWFAGCAAAVHPILVNSASQPYNENLFFLLFSISIWAFLTWLQTWHWWWTIVCGAAIGLCMLTRENAVLLLAAIGTVMAIALPQVKKTRIGFGSIALTAALVVVPWTIRNYVRFGVFVPVASILGEDLSEGNNDCVGQEGIVVPYWAEGPCASVEEQRRVLQATTTRDSRIPAALRRDRISQRIALRFIFSHPPTYAKLALRRLWTSLLPFDPRGNQRLHERIVLTLYWVLLFPAGIMGVKLGLQEFDPGRILLAVLILLNLLSIAAVLYWSDLRFRVGVDLLLGCFAGWAYSQYFAFEPERTPASLQLDSVVRL